MELLTEGKKMPLAYVLGRGEGYQRRKSKVQGRERPRKYDGRQKNAWQRETKVEERGKE